MSTVAPVLESKRLRIIKENARPAEAPCLCGCGALTRARFAPGHDATLRQSLRATVEAGSPAAKRTARAALKQFGWA